MHPYDPNVLTKQMSTMGLTSLGGVAGLVFGADRLLPQGSRTRGQAGDSWDEARKIIWPIKLMFGLAGKAGLDVGTPSREEKSPYVNYTPMEYALTDSDFGLGVRKVRHDQELRFALFQYKSYVRKLKLLAAGTQNRAHKERYMENIQELGSALNGMARHAYQQEFK